MHAHHAYVYEGPAALLQPLAEDACTRFGFTAGSNPDVHVESWEKFGIDESRALVMQTSLRSVGGRALFLLGIMSITSEAQQALLKLFEEPGEGVMFVVLVPHGTLLPTLRSRFLDYPHKGISGVEISSQEISTALEFLSWPYAKRSAWVTAFLKGDDDGVREKVRAFVNDIEVELYKHLSKNPKEIGPALADVAHFRGYLADRAPSIKMILEHFAATLPTLK